MRRARRLSLALAIAVIAAAVVPWGDFQGHTHWDKVGWIPLVSPPVRLRDIIANLLLFAPLGIAVALNTAPSLTSRRCAALAAGLSFAGEWTQLYSHTRFPSATDVLSNVTGALAAALIARAWFSRSG